MIDNEIIEPGADNAVLEKWAPVLEDIEAHYTKRVTAQLLDNQAKVLMEEGYISALFHRNKLVVRDSDRVVAFWDKKSRGTLDTLTTAKTAKKKVSYFNVG